MPGIRTLRGLRFSRRFKVDDCIGPNFHLEGKHPAVHCAFLHPGRLCRLSQMQAADRRNEKGLRKGHLWGGPTELGPTASSGFFFSSRNRGRDREALDARVFTPIRVMKLL